MVTADAFRLDDGSFQARVALTALAPGHTRSQCFLDLEYFPTEELALRRAEQAGLQWVDVNG
ncbi:MAG: hypothetical protein RLZZ618_1395 [Pseudomonadota bacterium]|jgi:hypothetical protein